MEQDAEGVERLVGFNASEEPASALLNFFEYDRGFRLLHKVAHRLQVQTVAHTKRAYAFSLIALAGTAAYLSLGEMWADLSLLPLQVVLHALCKCV